MTINNDLLSYHWIIDHFDSGHLNGKYTGCTTKHASWWIVENVFFLALLSYLIPNGILKILYGSQIVVKLLSE